MNKNLGVIFFNDSKRTHSEITLQNQILLLFKNFWVAESAVWKTEGMKTIAKRVWCYFSSTSAWENVQQMSIYCTVKRKVLIDFLELKMKRISKWIIKFNENMQIFGGFRIFQKIIWNISKIWNEPIKLKNHDNSPPKVIDIKK